MFEMLITMLAALFASIWAATKIIFMDPRYSKIILVSLAVLIIVLILIVNIRRSQKKAYLEKINVVPGDYQYYDKFTSPLYRIGYFISYLIQNILFDYTYMKRNFNFCKGLDVYNGGVSEYYIKFRNTWYRYLKLTLLRHKVSLNKLKSYACNMKNELIYNGIEDDEIKAKYKEFNICVREHFAEFGMISKADLNSFPHVDELNKLYKKNIMKSFKALTYAQKKEPKIVDLVNRQEYRSKRDVNDFKKMNI